MYAGTDINSAMLEGITLVRDFLEEDERAPVILFLTDGVPTSGVRNGGQILKNVQQANEGECALKARQGSSKDLTLWIILFG